MFSILIPVLKQGFLPSQLTWLSKQTYRDFTVVAMDSFYAQNRYQAWANKEYPFRFIHVPLIHNISFPKTFDFSIKNNLALLSPTKDFIFLSDTQYMTPTFTATVAQHVLQGHTAFFGSVTLLYTAFDSNRQTVDIGGQTTAVSKPAILYNPKLFFYVLNGFDEAMTYCSGQEFMVERTANACAQGSVEEGYLFHILHDPLDNDFGRKWVKPCDKCAPLFPRWKFEAAVETGEFPLGRDPELYIPFLSRDPMLGIPVFQCPNCGYGGCNNPSVYRDLIMREKMTDAPKSAFDGRTGRDLLKVYETMVSQVNNDLASRLAFLKTTY